LPTKMSEFDDVLSYIVNILIGLSLAGCVLTIITFVIFKELRTYPIKLIVYLSFSIFFASLFFLMSFSVYDTYFCIPSAMIFHYFFLANFFWSFCVAFNFYQMIVRRNREAELIEKWYHLGSWIIPAVIIALVSIFDEYGNIGGVCYIKKQFTIFLAFFLPGLTVVSANAVIFFFIAREIHDTLSAAPQADSRREGRKEFRVYLSIFISIGLNWFLGFIMVLIPAGAGRDVILVLFEFTTPLQGFFIFGSYCINGKVFGKWAGLFGKCFPFCKQWEHLGSSKSTGSKA